MGRKTKLESISFKELNGTGMADMAKMLKNALKSTYMKMDALHYRGYEESDYNANYRDMMGQTRAEAQRKVDKLVKDHDFAELKRLAYYTKRHMKAEESTVKGVEEAEKRGFILLEKISKGLKPTDKLKYTLTRERQGKGTVYETEGFRLKTDKTDMFLTHQQLVEIWKTIRKVDELQSLRTLKEGSGDSIAAIFDMIIIKGKQMTPQEIYEELKKQSKKIAEEDAKKQEEYDKRLESKKGGRRRWSTRQ